MEADVTTLDTLTLLASFAEGLLSRADISDWVDARIIETTRHSDALLQLTLLSHLHDDEIVDLLRALRGGSYAGETMLRVSMLAGRYRRGEIDYLEAHRRLWALPNTGTREDEQLEWSLWGVTDAIDLMEAGIYGTREDVVAQLDALFERLVPIE